MFDPVELTIRAKPMTKKNSQRVANNIPRPSEAFTRYQEKALWLLKTQYRDAPIEEPCRITAIFYRDNRCDLDNLCAGLLDVLQAARVLKNDRLVMRLVASKSSACDGRPRTHVRIESIPEEST